MRGVKIGCWGGAGAFSGYSDEAYAAKGCKVCGPWGRYDAVRGRALSLFLLFSICAAHLLKLRQRLSVSVMRLFSLVFVLVASLVHSEEVQHLQESKKLSEASGLKEE